LLWSDLVGLPMVVVIGTSGTVLPVDHLFARSKAYSIRVNLEPGTQMNGKAFSEQRYDPATQQLPEMWANIGLSRAFEEDGFA